MSTEKMMGLLNKSGNEKKEKIAQATENLKQAIDAYCEKTKLGKLDPMEPIGSKRAGWRITTITMIREELEQNHPNEASNLKKCQDDFSALIRQTTNADIEAARSAVKDLDAHCKENYLGPSMKITYLSKILEDSVLKDIKELVATKTNEVSEILRKESFKEKYEKEIKSFKSENRLSTVDLMGNGGAPPKLLVEFMIQGNHQAVTDLLKLNPPFLESRVSQLFTNLYQALLDAIDNNPTLIDTDQKKENCCKVITATYEATNDKDNLLASGTFKYQNDNIRQYPGIVNCIRDGSFSRGRENLNTYKDELQLINKAIESFKDEDISNADPVKKIKRAALEKIGDTIKQGGTRQEISTLIQKTSENTKVTAGIFSHKTKDLLETLKKSKNINPKVEQKGGISSRPK